MTGPEHTRPVVGRFAPSPSGRLHLGNLACSLVAWLSAKSKSGRIILRIEDLDKARCPRRYADQLEEDLAWLGLLWDEGGSLGGPSGPRSPRTRTRAAARTRRDARGAGGIVRNGRIAQNKL